MAEKEPIIVIKKIYAAEAGHHGGSWKVAFADFMTALMAFFLVMWLVSQSEDVKKNVADYFSTPSIIEYNFSNYGVELTLEKLFLDLVNEPLKFFQAFIRPVDFSPNLMSMGSKKIALHHIAEQLGDHAQNVQVHRDAISFDIPTELLFLKGTAVPAAEFVPVMEKVKDLTKGLEDSDVFIESEIFFQSVEDKQAVTARKVGDQRLDMVSQKVQVHLEHESVDIYGRTKAASYGLQGVVPDGMMKFKVTHKKELEGERKPRQFKDLFGGGDSSMSVYDNFVKKLTDKQKAEVGADPAKSKQ